MNSSSPSLIEGVMHGDNLGGDGVEVLRAVARQLGEEGVGRRARVGRVAPRLHRRPRRELVLTRRRGRHDLGVENGRI